MQDKGWEGMGERVGREGAERGKGREGKGQRQRAEKGTAERDKSREGRGRGREEAIDLL